MFNRLRRLLWVVLTVYCLSAGFLPLQSAFAKTEGVRVNRALLIGMDNFVTRPSSYPSSTNNVFAMQEVLQASSVPFETIMIPSKPVTSVKALTKLIHATFEGSDADDVNYLYLCTHGEYDGNAQSEPVLLLSDGTQQSRLTPKALQAAFSGIKGTHVLFLDACYSGAFIGKGMYRQPRDVCFLGDQFKVITSSGAMEESWYWNAAQGSAASQEGAYPQGGFYFTQSLSQCLSPRYGFPADANKDGNITLTELYNRLLENHAASTPQAYPQVDDFVVFSYDISDAANTGATRAPIGDVTFSNVTQSETGNKLTLEFIALKPVRVAYQIVRPREGQWQFTDAQLVYDNVEQYTAFGDERGATTAGRKVRTLTLPPIQDQASGYLLVQLVSIDHNKLTVHAGKVISIPPKEGDLALGVDVARDYDVSNPQELAVFVRHAFPCQLSVTVVNAKNETVYRLSHKQSTRPLRITPEGSTFYWNGCDKTGAPVPAGKYRVRVTGYMGQQTFTAESGVITLRVTRPQ